MGDRDVLMTIRFNGDPEAPEFTVSAHDLISAGERETATTAIRRILGCDIDLKPLYEAAGIRPGTDPENPGSFMDSKRMARASFF